MIPEGRPHLTDELVARFAAYCSEHGAWGSLHVVLDDSNLADVFVRHAIGWARDVGDTEGEELARILLTLTRSQRARLERRASRASRWYR